MGIMHDVIYALLPLIYIYIYVAYHSIAFNHRTVFIAYGALLMIKHSLFRFTFIHSFTYASTWFSFPGDAAAAATAEDDDGLKA